MITLTAIIALPLGNSSLSDVRRDTRDALVHSVLAALHALRLGAIGFFFIGCGVRAVPHFDALAGKFLSIVVQTPGGHLRGLAVSHAHDDVAVPRPRML